MKLNWRKTASEMTLASVGDFSYTIFRRGDSGYFTLGRTSIHDGIMVTVGNKFLTQEDAEVQALKDYDQATESS